MAPTGFCDLPTEALDEIARRVGPLDNVACSAVCRPWRRALKTMRLRLLRRPDLPYHVCVEPRYKDSPWESDYYYKGGPKRQTWTNKILLCPIRRYNPENFIGVALDTTGKVHPVRPTRIIGCSYGWVVTVDKAHALSLLEPLTGRRFPLPPITSSLGRTRKVVKNINLLGQDMFHKAALAPGRRLGTYAVMLIHSGGYGLSFLGPGAKCWTALREPAWTPKSYVDVIFHKGAFYTVSVDSQLNAWEPDGSCTGLRPRLVANPRAEPMRRAMLVKSATHDDLLLATFTSWSSLFDVLFRYDERQRGWIPTVNRGDMMILLKNNISLCISWKDAYNSPPMSPHRWPYEYILYSSDSYGSCFGLDLRHGCWFRPYVAPEFHHR
ncbi:hypothetical protein ACQ4PT_068047 [Festuca glaucescens]